MPSAPAAHGIFSTLFCESFLRCLSPYPGGSTECTCLVLPQRHRPSPNEKWVGFPRPSREHDFSRTPISGLQLFLYVQASEFACLPGRSHRYRFPCRAAEAFTSEPNVHRCLCTHRICYPPDYRQLAERGLTPRKIHSIVDCSSHVVGSPHRQGWEGYDTSHDTNSCVWRAASCPHCPGGRPPGAGVNVPARARKKFKNLPIPDTLAADDEAHNTLQREPRYASCLCASRVKACARSARQEMA